MKIFRDVHRTVCRYSRRDVKNNSLYVLLKSLEINQFMIMFCENQR